MRRLAAIMATDIVGYSRHMTADEIGTLAALRSTQQEILAPVVAARGGRVIKFMGDGTLVEFASVVDAVECAAEIQRGVCARDVSLPHAGTYRNIRGRTAKGRVAGMIAPCFSTGPKGDTR